ncbi:unnamed protein product [Lactuca saligna]|uniref:Uncharacterized protein n=1 Tax=Lactuca saligna TaxID=75948 RepID=A0AA35ZZ20_LACSI|nr:unnamed protein product [Lactuca saligna]
MGLKVRMLVQTKDFLNIQFNGFKGTNYGVHEFTLADLPFMNPYDWISLFYIVAKDEKKYESIFAHLKRMIKCYILEIVKIDVEIATILKKMAILKPEEQLNNIE